MRPARAFFDDTAVERHQGRRPGDPVEVVPAGERVPRPADHLDLVDVVPERGIEAQHQLLEPAEADRLDRTAMLRRQRRIESDCATFQYTEGHGDDDLRRPPLSVCGVDDDAVGLKQRDSGHRSRQSHRKAVGEPPGELAVPGGEHALRSGVGVVLVEGTQRQGFRCGAVVTGVGVQGGGHRWAAGDVAHPLRKCAEGGLQRGFPGRAGAGRLLQIADHLRAAVVDLVGVQFCSAGRVVHRRAAAVERPHIEHRGDQTEAADLVVDGVAIGAVNPRRAQVDRQIGPLRRRMDAPAHPVAGLQHDRRQTGARDEARGRQSGDAGPDHRDIDIAITGRRRGGVTLVAAGREPARQRPGNRRRAGQELPATDLMDMTRRAHNVHLSVTRTAGVDPATGAILAATGPG